QQLRLGVRARANGRAREPRVADLADIGRRAPVQRVSGGPGPAFEVEEPRRADHDPVAGANDREGGGASFIPPLERGLDIRGRGFQALRHRAPLIELRVTGGRGHESINVMAAEWLESNEVALQDRCVGCHIRMIYDLGYNQAIHAPALPRRDRV